MICQKIKKCVECEVKGEKSIDCTNKRVECIRSSDHRSNITCLENARRYNYVNTWHNHVIHFVVDGGMIRDDRMVPERTERCDRMLVCNSSDGIIVILVELKGKQVRDAMQQIAETIKQYTAFLNDAEKVYARAVVVSSVPNLHANPSYVKCAEYVKKHKGNILIEENDFSERDDRM